MTSSKIHVSEIKLQAFCQRWLVTEFALFGSILRDDFQPESDVDVLISFSPDARWSVWDLVTMQQELEQLFERKVDLIENGAIRNPFRRENIMRSKEVLYADV